MRGFLFNYLPSVLMAICFGVILSFFAINLCTQPKEQKTYTHIHIETVDDSDDLDGDGIPDWFYDLPEPEKRVVVEEQTVHEAAVGYSEEDLELLSHLIMGESGATYCQDEMLYMVGSVALNRVASDRFPNTLREVIFQEGQYASVSDGNFDKEPTERCLNIAKELLEGGSILPADVVYQAEFEQGSSTYIKIQNMYFCNL